MLTSNKLNYINYGYNSFLDNWQNYYKNNFLTFWEELNNVKSSLSKENQQEIDHFINTILFKLPSPASKYLIKKEHLYNTKELKQIKKEAFTPKEEAVFKYKYNLPKHFLLQTAVFRYHNGLKYLPSIIKQFIKNKIILDCGAYYGDSSLIFNKYKPNKIFAFEPCTINYNHLTTTIKNNALTNTIIPVNIGLSDRNGFFDLHFNSLSNPNLGAKLIVNHNKTNKNSHKEIVKVTTIDSFIHQNNIQDVALIKIDIEGLELEALLGAKNTIKKYKPIILAAIYHNAEEFLYCKPFLESLNLNYKFLIVPLDSLDILKEYYLIAY